MVWVTKQTIDGFPFWYNDQSKEVTFDKPDAMRSAEELEEESGDWVWVPHPTQKWQPARIMKTHADGTVECKTAKGKSMTIPKGEIVSNQLTGGRKQAVPLWPVLQSSLRMLEEDLVMLDNVNEALINHNLMGRYQQDQLYTWVGAGRSVLVSVNPYKDLPLYTMDQINLHRNRPPNRPLPPHVFDIANDSFDTMMFENKNQSILISGESGAGKTVATKQCLDFLAKIAGSKSDVEQKILVANPLLEAFGNANTIRNNNSSRFGKWIEVHFDKMERSIIGAQIVNYLLERSRVVFQQANERNYHIFYQMCGDKSTRSKYGLSKPSKHGYLNQSGCYKAKGIDDEAGFQEVKEAMQKLGFSAEEQEWTLRLAAGVLLLGDITFKAKNEKGSVDGSKVANKAALEQVAKHFNTTTKALEKVLCYRSISVKRGGMRGMMGNKEVSTIPLDPAAAKTGRDSLARGVYGRLFDWLVQRINESFAGARGKFIGILDIFGFEIFDQNSFEQLCINFANEKLQQQFNRTTFKEEEALYVSENIDFEHVDFIDNQQVLDLIEAKPAGVLILLDDEGIIPEGSDDKLMNRLEERYKRNPKFQTDTHRKLQSSLAFEIEHYAGVVKYDADGFLMKNKDTLFGDMQRLMSASKSKATAALFPVADNGTTRIQSLSYVFRGQLNVLMEALYSTDARYIRCVKPNSKQVPDKYDAPMVIDQLRYSGVFEAIDIRQKGYPFRYKYSQFACRYSCINTPCTYRASPNDFEALAQELLDRSSQDFSGVQFGRTMVLYRTKEHKTLELLRNLALERLIPQAQKAMRGHLSREMGRRLRKAEAAIEAAMKVGNDLAMLQAAIDNVPEIIGTMETLFDYQPRNMEAGLKHLEELKKWKAIEEELESLTQKDPNTVYYDLKEVCAKAAKLKMNRATARQRELIDKANELRASCELGKIDAQAKAAVAVVDRERMQDALERARKYNHSTDDLREIDRLLSLPEKELVELEMNKAKEMDDQKRFVHREIRFKELYLEEVASQYKSLNQYAKKQDATVWASKKFFGKKKAAERIFLWQSGGITGPITIIEQGDAVENAKTIKQMFTNILKFMGDKKSPDPFTNAADVLVCGVRNPHYRDELYALVMKQLSDPYPVKPGGNDSKAAKRAESVQNGWQLMGMMLSTFPPSEEFEFFLMQFIKDNAQEDAGKFLSALHGVQYGGAADEPTAAAVQQILSEFQNLQRGRFSCRPGQPTGPTN